MFEIYSSWLEASNLLTAHFDSRSEFDTTLLHPSCLTWRYNNAARIHVSVWPSPWFPIVGLCTYITAADYHIWFCTWLIIWICTCLIFWFCTCLIFVEYCCNSNCVNSSKSIVIRLCELIKIYCHQIVWTHRTLISARGFGGKKFTCNSVTSLL